MGKKMLIDAAHREETRVAIVSGNRVENFDFESEAKRPLRGNIYLAKVTRVEPSLQAAFIEYGGNRHGFLAFSEIHPDYYQIPVADREKLLAEEAEENRAREAREDADDAFDDDDGNENTDGADEAEETPVVDPDSSDTGLAAAEDTDADDNKTDSVIAASAVPVESVSENVTSEDNEASSDDDSIGDAPESDIEEIEDEDSVEEVTSSEDDEDDEVGDDDEDDEDEDEDEDDDAGASADASSDGEKKDGRRRRSAGRDQKRGQNRGAGRGRNGGTSNRRPARNRSRHYKIQEVIKRRQILLVQVVKEERGNKGAALTTYLSLAGRYCVLMPNTARGGGISRKITNTSDRRRLKEAMNEMDVSDGMGLIVRTAGANRTKVEIKRDFDYLLRLWENIRDLTLKSSAPALIYEEGDLIKRSIRDQYSKDIDEIIVDGDAAYKDAKEFMRMLMPSHAKNVKRYTEREPLLQRFGVQSELDALLEPTVTLKSGGYIVINPTEALVSIDVNSGKSTKEHNIEATALSTNMEAAEEIARQLRLRDMAGLIVIDFIDMDEPRNNRSVENKLKDNLKQDRARIQVGRISSFGLLEMSRQRMRSGVLEGSTDACPHCKGTGIVRSSESAALQVLRAIEAEAAKGKASGLDVSVAADVAVFILNQKRATLLDIERRCRVSIYLLADNSLIAPAYTIKRTDDRTPDLSDTSTALSMESAFDDDDDAALDAAAEAAARAEEEADSDEGRTAEGDNDEKPKRKRRRRPRGGRKSGDQDEQTSNGSDSDASAADTDTDGSDDKSSVDRSSEEDELDEDGKPRKRRRRGRRGGRRHRRTSSDETDGQGTRSDGEGDTSDAIADKAVSDDASSDEAPVLVGYASGSSEPLVVERDAASAAPEPQAQPEREPEPVLATAMETTPADAAPSADTSPVDTPPDEPAKRGWWQRRISS
ncbi:Rne/Rng family ribonuclease [Pyruvatibacter sp.]|uniref:Rne/Rng family ribonuclease n=1 Tax=Pyruvatibacter sp. TaxID=1981328 RepID=UPI0032EED0C6